LYFNLYSVIFQLQTFENSSWALPSLSFSTFYTIFELSFVQFHDIRKGFSRRRSLRVSKKPQTVKIGMNGNRKQCHCEATCGRGNPFFLRPRKACCARYFDLLRKPDSTVPMYADESGLLVFAAPLTSASLSKKGPVPTPARGPKWSSAPTRVVLS